jgi:hypothetical protein
MARRFLPLTALVVLACSSSGTPRTDLPPPEYEVRTHGAAAASVSATADAEAAPASSGDAKLAEIGERFLSGWLARQPVHATEAGDHRFDGKWPDVSEAGDAAYETFLLGAKKELDAVDDATLSLEASIDKRIMLNQIALGVLAIHELRAPENDPLFYTGLVGDGLDPLVTREFAPASERAKSLAARLQGVPAIVAVAKKRLKTPPEIHTKTAIEQNQGLVALCKKDLADLIKQAGAEGPALEKAAKTAAAALEDFQTFLEKDLKKRSTGEFRLGRALYEKKLRLLLDDPIDADSLAKDARALLDSTRHDMLATSKELWPELEKGKPWKDPKDDAEERAIIREVLSKLAEDRSSNATIVKDAEQTLALATASACPTSPARSSKCPSTAGASRSRTATRPARSRRTPRRSTRSLPRRRTGRRSASSRSTASTTRACSSTSPCTRRCRGTSFKRCTTTAFPRRCARSSRTARSSRAGRSTPSG